MYTHEQPYYHQQLHSQYKKLPDYNGNGTEAHRKPASPRSTLPEHQLLPNQPLMLSPAHVHGVHELLVVVGKQVASDCALAGGGHHQRVPHDMLAM